MNTTEDFLVNQAMHLLSRGSLCMTVWCRFNGHFVPDCDCPVCSSLLHLAAARRYLAAWQDGGELSVAEVEELANLFQRRGDRPCPK